jgi:phosphoribosylamine--glycine ligase
VLEFNCRFGDPETQPILMRLQSDLHRLCLEALEGRLDSATVDWDPRPALGVVLAAEGYPRAVREGDPLSGHEASDDPDVKVFHAGTRLAGDQVVTAGGRVLCVSALGATVQEAQHRAYQRIAAIRWQGMVFRRDIGHRAIARESALPQS